MPRFKIDYYDIVEAEDRKEYPTTFQKICLVIAVVTIVIYLFIR